MALLSRIPTLSHFRVQFAFTVRNEVALRAPGIRSTPRRASRASGGSEFPVGSPSRTSKVGGCLVLPRASEFPVGHLSNWAQIKTLPGDAPLSLANGSACSLL